MDDRERKAAIIKQARRELLDALKMFFPSEASFETLRHTLPAIAERHLQVDLSYLVAKKYVTCTNDKSNMSWSKRKYMLTGSGVEHADAIILDPALEP